MMIEKRSPVKLPANLPAQEKCKRKGADILDQIGNGHQSRRLQKAHISKKGKLRRSQRMTEEKADEAGEEARKARP